MRRTTSSVDQSPVCRPRAFPPATRTPKVGFWRVKLINEAVLIDLPVVLYGRECWTVALRKENFKVKFQVLTAARIMVIYHLKYYDV
jgi:hypothetical protein